MSGVLQPDVDLRNSVQSDSTNEKAMVSQTRTNFTQDRLVQDTLLDTMHPTRQGNTDHGLNPAAPIFVPGSGPYLIRQPVCNSNAVSDPHIEYEDIFNDINSVMLCRAPKSVNFPQTVIDESAGYKTTPTAVLESVTARQTIKTEKLNIQSEYGLTAIEASHSELPSAIMLYHSEGNNTDTTIPRTLHYIPLRPTLTADMQPTFTALRLARAVKASLDKANQQGAQQSCTCVWPVNVIPVEIFEHITCYLARQDVKTMRLINHEFEEKVAHCLFQTSVVPFNTELYDMVDEDNKQLSIHYQAYTQWLRAQQAVDPDDKEATSNTLLWPNENEDVDNTLYKGHGLKVFQGFGRYIHRFGLSFEVSEQFLAQPPVKHELDHIQAYFGDYSWPSGFYARFAPLAGLERIADETSRMQAAFATLQVVRELALSVDSGLGWISGPDKSAYTEICNGPTPIFRSDQGPNDAKSFWQALQASFRACVDHAIPLAEHNVACASLNRDVSQLPGLKGTRYADTALWPSAVAYRKDELLYNSTEGSSGIIYLTPDFPDSIDDWCKNIIKPNDLRKEQIEWLLETEWAQRAFLESYVLAIINNPLVFSNVTTLSLVKISSGLLSHFSHSQLWETLTSLSDVTVKVSVDWRTVQRDDAGVVQTYYESPTVAYSTLLSLITTHIQVKASIRKLHIGYTSGGEHANGMFARNQHIMPAPLTAVDEYLSSKVQLQINLPHVEDFTLSNCWVAPNVLEAFVHHHAFSALKRLSLCSVSLTVHPDPSAINQTFYMEPNVAWHSALAAHAATIEFRTPFTSTASGLRSSPTPGGPPDPRAAVQAPSDKLWTIKHRAGSWQVLLNNIAPGENFVCFRCDSIDPRWDTGNPHGTTTNLRSIDLQSVGYANINGRRGPESRISASDRELSAWFKVRQKLLKPAMMQMQYGTFTEIVQHVGAAERQALAYAWGLQHGWDDREASEAATFDGKQPGGTGRFSGVIKRLQL